MNHGLSDKTVARITDVFRTFPTVEKAILFGSRAKGCARPSSDIDLTLMGEIDRRTLAQIENALDDLLLPYRFRLSVHAMLKDADFLAHIERVGVLFYDKDLTAA